MNVTFAQVGGLRTRILAEGSEGPAVLLVHGGGLSADVFAPNIRGLGADFRVAAADLPGCGFTEPGDYTRQSAARLCRDHLFAVADSLGFEEFSIVGSSFGAQVAVLARLARPERVRSLVLTASASAFYPPARVYASVREALHHCDPSTPGRHQEAEAERQLRQLAPAAGPQLAEILLPYTTARALPGHAAATAAMLTALQDPPRAEPWHVRDKLGRVGVPTLVVWGGQDPRVPLADAREAISALPAGRLEVFEDSGHLPFLEEPARFNRLVADFLRHRPPVPAPAPRSVRAPRSVPAPRSTPQKGTTMRTDRRTTVLLASLGLVGLSATAGCAGTTASAQSSDTVTIGVVVSTTGASAPFGIQQEQALKLAEKDINGSGRLGALKLKFVFTDDHSQVSQASALYDQLINAQHVAAIIGPTSSTSAQTTSPVAQAQHVPVLLVSASAVKGITDVGDQIWRDSLTDAQLIPQAVAAAKKAYHVKRAVLLYADDDATTQSSAKTFETALRAQGIEVAAKLSFASTDKDFAAQLTQAKQAKADALFVAAVPQGGIGLLQQARQLGITLPVVGSNGFNSPAFLSGAGAAADNTLVASAWDVHSTNPLSTAFVTEYHKAYGKDPDQFSAQAYAGATILAQAVADGGGDRAGILAGLKKVKDLPTVLGAFNFTSGRDGSYKAVPLLIKNDTYTPLN
ncbi:alpha/beta fold hydrolase [Streptacidiphilus sp. N1-12]|uniref:Alpha/beta fold hydrolase n=2 Tax=Streptacidiphilus alkalitolerans TaxID=3342712 RepID=A0ABV6WF54_9ACTN